MTGNQDHAPKRSRWTQVRSATRFKVNRNWTRRGDNTKYKAKK